MTAPPDLMQQALAWLLQIRPVDLLLLGGFYKLIRIGNRFAGEHKLLVLDYRDRHNCSHEEFSARVMAQIPPDRKKANGLAAHD